MANEITISMGLRYAKNKASAALTGGFQVDQTGINFEAGTQTIGTTEEPLAKGDVGTIGWAAIRNTDATNYVEYGTATGVYGAQLDPGEAVCLNFNKTNIYMKANTAAVAVEFLIIEK